MAMDWTDPNAVKKAVGDRKNFLLGVGVVALLVFLAVWFYGQSSAKAALAPWRKLTDVGSGAPAFPYEMDLERLERVVAETEGTPAEPYALYWLAMQRFSQNKETEAVETMEALRQKFGDSYLFTVNAPVPRDPSVSAPMGARIGQEMVRFLEASAQSPVPRENPLPADRRTVTLVTENGDRIELTLLQETSPENCRAFARIAHQLESSTIALAVEASWLELGLDEDGETWPLEDLEGPFPPYEENAAFHFKGSVAFRQAPFRDGPYDRGLKIWLKDDFSADGVSTVFAQVSSGLEVLERLAAGEKGEQRATKLATPVRISTVELSVGDLAETASGADSSEEGDGSSNEGEAGSSQDGASSSEEGGGGNEDG